MSIFQTPHPPLRAPSPRRRRYFQFLGEWLKQKFSEKKAIRIEGQKSIFGGYNKVIDSKFNLRGSEKKYELL